MQQCYLLNVWFRFCGGLVDDVKRKMKWYVSDFKDALAVQSIASIIFLYFASMTPLVTFGGLMNSLLHGRMVSSFCQARILCPGLTNSQILLGSYGDYSWSGNLGSILGIYCWTALGYSWQHRTYSCFRGDHVQPMRVSAEASTYVFVFSFLADRPKDKEKSSALETNELKITRLSNYNLEDGTVDFKTVFLQSRSLEFICGRTAFLAGIYLEVLEIPGSWN